MGVIPNSFVVVLPFLLPFCHFMSALSLNFTTDMIVIIGDSTSARLAASLAIHLGGCVVIKTQERCDFASYYGTPYSKKKLRQHIPKGLGPTSYGKVHRGCQDCFGCWSSTWNCQNNTLNLEYIGIEFALDVEYPTLEYDTTQESIIHNYLKHQNSVRYIYFNTGLHDAGIDNKAKVSNNHLLYRKNLEFTLQLLLDIFGPESVVWLTSTAIVSEKQPRKWRKVTSNKKVRLFNRISVDITKSMGVKSIDLFKISQQKRYRYLNQDGIHWGEPYEGFYSSVAKMIMSDSHL